MNTFSRFLLLGLGILLFSPAARPDDTILATLANEPPSLPAETPPQIRPDALPSASLQPFLDTHLGKIFAPLGDAAFAQTEIIASMKASYADGMAAAPAAHRPAYQIAQNVCDALTNAVAERATAASALRGALATRSSEATQPSGGGEAVRKARETDAFFMEGQQHSWTQRVGVLRQNINALYLRERAVERQTSGWPSPLPTSIGLTAAAATPSVSSPARSTSFGSDPALGPWVFQGGPPFTLEADYQITGNRQGYWTCYLSSGTDRHYDLHWAADGGVDYLVLTPDGKCLYGRTWRGWNILYYRP